jgi:hypothetical protein
VGACEFPHGNGTSGPTKRTPGLNANYSDCIAALVMALEEEEEEEEEEEKNLIWVMQVNRP